MLNSRQIKFALVVLVSVWGGRAIFAQDSTIGSPTVEHVGSVPPAGLQLPMIHIPSPVKSLGKRLRETEVDTKQSATDSRRSLKETQVPVLAVSTPASLKSLGEVLAAKSTAPPVSDSSPAVLLEPALPTNADLPLQSGLPRTAVPAEQVPFPAPSDTQAEEEAMIRALFVLDPAKDPFKNLSREQQQALLTHRGLLLYRRQLEKLLNDVETSSEICKKWFSLVDELHQSQLDRDGVRSIADQSLPEIDLFIEELRGTLRVAVGSFQQTDTSVIAEMKGGRVSLLLDDELLLDQLDLTKQYHWGLLNNYMRCLKMINKAREGLVALVSVGVQADQFGFGPVGVRQALAEYDQLELRFRFHVLSFMPLGFGAMDDFLTSPVPVIWVLFKCLFLAMIFFVWSRKWAPRIDAWRNDSSVSISHNTGVMLWLLFMVRRPLELYLFVTAFSALLNQCFPLPTLLIFQRAVFWFALSSLAVKLLNAMLLSKNLRTVMSRSEQDRCARLQLRSLRIVAFWLSVSIFFLELADMRGVGEGTVYHWIRHLSIIAVLPVVFAVIMWWKAYIFEKLEALPEHNLARVWGSRLKRGPLKYPAAAFAGGYLFCKSFFEWGILLASGVELLQPILALLFRAEVARKSMDRLDGFTPLGEDMRATLDRADDAFPCVTDYALAELEQIADSCQSQKPGLTVVVGEHGGGKSTVLRRLQGQFEDKREVVLVQCPFGGFAALMPLLAEALGLPGDADRQMLETHLRRRSSSVICIDNAQRLIYPRIGGLEDIDELCKLVRVSAAGSRWVITLDKTVWQFMKRARAELMIFDAVVELPVWTEKQIQEMVKDCIATSKINPNFNHLIIPRQFDKTNDEGAECTEDGYYRVLRDYTEGNPTLALHYWKESLFVVPKDGRKDDVQVHLFRTPDLRELEQLPTFMYFVLRTILQLEHASTKELIDCTGFADTVIQDSLRLLSGKGYITHEGDRHKVSWHWFRAIVTILHRKHLLAK